MAKTKKGKKKVITRKNEERFFTSDPAEMKGKYTATDVLKKWVEDFVDEDTGRVESIERQELIVRRGEWIEGDILAKIQFYIQSKEIEGVEVSNQRRQATLFENGSLFPWSVTARINGKNRRFLLYAFSINSAVEIAKDYIELKFKGGFDFKDAKMFDSCFFLKTDLPEGTEGQTPAEAEDDPTEHSFYKIEIELRTDDFTTTYTFVLQAKNIDAAMVRIKEWILDKLNRENRKRNKSAGEDSTPEFTTVLKSGVVIPCYRIIEREFSKAYTAGDSYDQ